LRNSGLKASQGALKIQGASTSSTWPTLQQQRQQ
jgi:hypothetical protein